MTKTTNNSVTIIYGKKCSTPKNDYVPFHIKINCKKTKGQMATKLSMLF